MLHLTPTMIQRILTKVPLEIVFEIVYQLGMQLVLSFYDSINTEILQNGRKVSKLVRLLLFTLSKNEKQKANWPVGGSNP